MRNQISQLNIKNIKLVDHLTDSLHIIFLIDQKRN